MENATKALIIAAAVLIVIIIIALGIKILSSASDARAQAEKTAGLIDSQTNTTVSKLKDKLLPGRPKEETTNGGEASTEEGSGTGSGGESSSGADPRVERFTVEYTSTYLNEDTTTGGSLYDYVITPSGGTAPYKIFKNRVNDLFLITQISKSGKSETIRVNSHEIQKLIIQDANGEKVEITISNSHGGSTY